jgi:hypothetical protein
MALKRLDTGIKRLAGGIPKRTKKPLAFIPPSPDPMIGLPEGKTNEESIGNEVKAVESSIMARLKADAKRKEIATSAEYYFVVCFEDGNQASTFLKALKYPDDNAAFIDGTILADILNIELPVAEKMKPLREPDRALARLVQPAWRK